MGLIGKQCTLKYYSSKRRKYSEIQFYKDLVKILSPIIAGNRDGMLITYHPIEVVSSWVLKYFAKIGLNNKDPNARTNRNIL